MNTNKKIAALAAEKVFEKLGIKEGNTIKTVLPETGFEADAERENWFDLPQFTLEAGKKYKIVIDGGEYVAVGQAGDGFVFCGNPGIIDGDQKNTGGGWVIVSDPTYCDITFDSIDTARLAHDIAIYEMVKLNEPIKEKYIPGEFSEKINQLKRDGGVGYDETSNVELTSSPVDSPVIVDELVGCRLKAKTGRWRVKNTIPENLSEGELCASILSGGHGIQASAINDFMGDGSGLRVVAMEIILKGEASEMARPVFAPTVMLTNDAAVLMYFYEDFTIEEEGASITFSKGWNVSAGGGYEPIDLDKHPVYFSLAGQEPTFENLNPDFYKIVEYEEYVDFVITEKHLMHRNSETVVFGFEYPSEEAAGLGLSDAYYITLNLVHSVACITDSGTISSDRGATLTKLTIHPISDKYLPGVCLPVVVDLTSYGYIENGTQLSDTTLYGTCVKAIEEGSMIWVKMDCNFAGTKLPGLTFIVGYQFEDEVLAMSATSAIPDIASGQLVKSGISIILTNQGAQVFMALSAF